MGCKVVIDMLTPIAGWVDTLCTAYAAVPVKLEVQGCSQVTEMG